MATFEIKMPKLGESVEEATIIKWFVKENDMVEEDQALLEIGTDKVDSEIPSPVAGRVIKILYKDNDKIAVGLPIAIIDLDGNAAQTSEPEKQAEVKEEKIAPKQDKKELETESSRFYSPLVKNIAQKENISITELEQLEGSGNNGRVRKDDVLQYLESRKSVQPAAVSKPVIEKAPQESKPVSKPVVVASGDDEIIEMDRMRKLIADHMVMSKQVFTTCYKRCRGRCYTSGAMARKK